jgi:hypothetical protein
MGEGPSGELVFSCLKCEETFLGERATLNHVFTFHPGETENINKCYITIPVAK